MLYWHSLLIYVAILFTRCKAFDAEDKPNHSFGFFFLGITRFLSERSMQFH